MLNFYPGKKLDGPTIKKFAESLGAMCRKKNVKPGTVGLGGAGECAPKFEST